MGGGPDGNDQFGRPGNVEHHGADLDAGRLDALDGSSGPDPVARLDTAKLLVTFHALRLRRDHPDWFAGSYEPLTAAGGYERASCSGHQRAHTTKGISSAPSESSRAGIARGV